MKQEQPLNPLRILEGIISLEVFTDEERYGWPEVEKHFRGVEGMFSEIIEKEYRECKEKDRWRFYERYKQELNSNVFSTVGYIEALRGVVYLLRL